MSDPYGGRGHYINVHRNAYGADVEIHVIGHDKSRFVMHATYTYMYLVHVSVITVMSLLMCMLQLVAPDHTLRTQRHS